ncbi:RtcB family protein [Sandaracinus amylolyticus]|uniref:RtcB family protein n=1 Tax=Sandaracinus amylolyticus TaxID=927083 RepID=UPI001F334206|nr:RtcB family protein [Sandaracinus amylolyticus]UJR84102.1 Hypothetical protein I5071_61730 [Sandaracinus amylolyticus]
MQMQTHHFDMHAPLERIDAVTWELPSCYRRDMRVPVRIFADETLIESALHDRCLEQLVNVATLPGVVRHVLAMPDVHEGYGFPVGGVAATALPDGVISPGGIGFDVNCGVRLLVSTLRATDVAHALPAVMHEISRSIPTGYGHGGRAPLDDAAIDRVLAGGAQYLVRERRAGVDDDLDRIESGGMLPGADPTLVSERARTRGRDQLGTLGGGNHFLEVQRVARVHDEVLAARLGIVEGNLTVLVHTGSRGLGHQVCTDFVRRMDERSDALGIVLPDRQLACAPLSSPEGREYLAAMAAAANFAFANRQTITHTVRAIFARMLHAFGDPTLHLVYDVAHNVAKIERYPEGELCVHRKGATRALGPSSAELAPALRGIGQPVLIPGSMGTASFVMVGRDASAELSFSSACHGAGRLMSRGAARRAVQGHVLRHELEARGIVVKCPSSPELAEEAPLAYKDVDRVVDVVERAGIATKVARLEPLGVLKG